MLRVFEFIVDENDDELGMNAISLVDKPAIESEYIAFSKEKKHTFIRFQDDKKFIVSGLALIPDKLIFRVDESTGEEYLGYFSAETIEYLMDKFMKDSTDGTLENVNFQHDSEDKVEAHLIESFIIRTPEMLTAVEAMSIKDATIGSWFVSYKFDNETDYDEAVSSEFTGFSVEVMLQRELKLNKNQIKNNVIMAKFKKFVDKFKNILEEMETEEVATLEDIEVPDTGKSLRIGDVGQPVVWVSVDDADAEVIEPAVEGEYVVADGRTIIVDDAGNLVEIKDSETAVEPIPTEDLTEPVVEPVKPVETTLTEELVVEPVVETLLTEEPVVEEPAAETENVMPAEVKAWLTSITGNFDDGEIYLSFWKESGEFKYGDVSTWADVKMSSDKEAEVVALTAEVVELKAQLDKPVTRPAFVEFNTPSEKSDNDFKGKSNLELITHKLGLDK